MKLARLIVGLLQRLVARPARRENGLLVGREAAPLPARNQCRRCKGTGKTRGFREIDFWCTGCGGTGRAHVSARGAGNAGDERQPPRQVRPIGGQP